MSEEYATLRREGSVSIITMNDGKANVFSHPMSMTIESLLDDVPKDSGSLLITGKSGILSGGFDLNVINEGTADDRRIMTKAGFSLLRRIYSFPRPVVVACTGHSIALGAFLLLCADYRIGIQGNFRIGANEIMNNMNVPVPILEIAKTRVATAHWYRAMLNSEIYPISDAVAPGYLDEVVEPDQLLPEALKKATVMAELGHPFYETTKGMDQASVLDRIDSAIASM
jgi:enoyl-CoA hydratase